ncbi:54S ribosomal protein L25, mitochondrial [Neonectria punicea]|uniref:54S ribosomal protein L25, mitochondrial n=1 Tax=Neonectria punicea TaxID=979145 RepID=A0ABR1GUF6_9HYPO
MASPSHYIQLAKSLPAPLQRFFARYPPATILPENAPKTFYQEERANPFRFYKHPVTGRWQDPVYSQRRQAELVSMAREHGVEELLPETRKGTEYRLAHRVEHGLRVKGTGVGQKVKGHIHERHMIAKMEKRRKAMLEMPKLIKAWKKASLESAGLPLIIHGITMLIGCL